MYSFILHPFLLVLMWYVLVHMCDFCDRSKFCIGCALLLFIYIHIYIYQLQYSDRIDHCSCAMHENPYHGC